VAFFRTLKAKEFAVDRDAFVSEGGGMEVGSKASASIQRDFLLSSVARYKCKSDMGKMPQLFFGRKASSATTFLVRVPFTLLKLGSSASF
jgi:hypothetical protein